MFTEVSVSLDRVDDEGTNPISCHYNLSDHNIACFVQIVLLFIPFSATNI